MRRLSPGALVMAGLLALGCGAGTGDVSGRVTYRGRTVVYGTVLLIGSDGIPRTGNIAADGRFRVDGVAVGSAKAAVASPDPVATYKKQTALQKSPDGREKVKPPPIDVKAWFPLPIRFADPDKSELIVEIGPGLNRHDFDLK